MKKDWSPKWQASLQPRKQRKYAYNAPLHTRQTFVRSMLSPELRKSYGKRNMQVRKGDEVKVMRGNLKGKTGIVERVDLRSSKIYVDEFKVKKVDGSEVPKPLQPSNIMITKLKLEDKKRQEILERAGQSKKPKTKTKTQEKIQDATKKETKTPVKEKPKEAAKAAPKQKPAKKPAAKASKKPAAKTKPAAKAAKKPTPKPSKKLATTAKKPAAKPKPKKETK